MNELVSIIIPYFNTDTYLLQKAIESALNQTYKNIEVVICDDGSSLIYKKGLEDLIQNYQNKVTLIVNKKNEGISSARNNAVKISKGTWLVWLDADDTLDPNCVYNLITKAVENNKYLVIGECNVFSDETIERRRPILFYELAKNNFKTERDPFMLNVISIQPQIIKRDIFDQVKGFNKKFKQAEMTEFFLRVISEFGIANISFIETALYNYNRNQTKSVSTNRNELFKFRKKALLQYRDRNKIDVDDIVYLERDQNTGMQKYYACKCERRENVKRNYFISKNVRFIDDFRIGYYSIIGDDDNAVTIVGKGAKIGDYCKVSYGTKIGNNLYMEDYSSIYNNVSIGDNLKLLNGIKIFSESEIGSDCIIGGDIAERCKLGNRVTFMGIIAHSHYNPKLDWETTNEPSPIIGDGTVIGCNAILIGGISIGKNCYVSAGEILRFDLPDNSVFINNEIKKISDFKGLIRTRY